MELNVSQAGVHNNPISVAFLVKVTPIHRGSKVTVV